MGPRHPYAQRGLFQITQGGPPAPSFRATLSSGEGPPLYTKALGTPKKPRHHPCACPTKAPRRNKKKPLATSKLNKCQRPATPQFPAWPSRNAHSQGVGPLRHADQNPAPPQPSIRGKRRFSWRTRFCTQKQVACPQPCLKKVFIGLRVPLPNKRKTNKSSLLTNFRGLDPMKDGSVRMLVLLLGHAPLYHFLLASHRLSFPYLSCFTNRKREKKRDSNTQYAHDYFYISASLNAPRALIFCHCIAFP